MARLGLLLLLSLMQSQAHALINLLVYDYPPLVETHQDTEPTGQVVDLIKPLFKRAEVPYQFVKQPLRRALHQTSQQRDYCAFPVARTQQREANFKWIGPIAITRHSFYSTSDNPIQLVTLNDAKELTIGVFAGSGVSKYLKDNRFKIYETSSIQQGMQMLKHRRIDLWVTEAQATKELANYGMTNLNSNLSFYTSISFMACNRDLPEKIHRALTTELSHMHRSGETQALLHVGF
ncbi:transporter substrate-binding domain-containing protein [Neiella marina]|uniref:Transporter substrate-binding domain-containing protein n=1 Tax=Neiella holothuriorum TaxID=2870530 RepID=A0ABS7EGU9_9GAMM|nr:transporter substrate-binding domain-containing protein [Neiella holothuriorum]MBW8191571.1 transporter substrate-binding domain-containing protein [Neiella holothuriorum]